MKIFDLSVPTEMSPSEVEPVQVEHIDHKHPPGAHDQAGRSIRADMPVLRVAN